MQRHFTALALRQLLIGPAYEAETARAIHHLGTCPPCLAKAAECCAQMKADQSFHLGATDSRMALVTLIDEQASGDVGTLRARGLWAEIREMSPAEQVRKIRSTLALQSISMFETILGDARATGLSDPFRGESTAGLAYVVIDRLPGRYSQEFKNDLRGEAMTVVANCRRIAADWSGSTDAIEEAGRHLAKGTGDPGLEAQLLSIHASLRTDTGDLERALKLVRRAAEIFGSVDDWEGVARTTVKEAGCLLAAYQATEAIEKANFALARIDPHDVRLEILARFIIIESLVILKRPLEGLSHFRKAKPIYEQIGDLGTRMRAAYVEARLLDGLGFPRESEKLFRNAVAVYFDHELYKEGFITLLTLFECLCQRGAVRKAADLCEEAIAATSQAGPACNDLIRRAWEDLLAAVCTRQISDAELVLARQFLVRNWCVPQGGALALPRLEAVVARANPAIELPAPLPPPPAEELRSGGYKAALEAYDRELIAAALKENGGSIKATARFLGVSRNGLREKIRKYGLASGISVTEE